MSIVDGIQEIPAELLGDSIIGRLRVIRVGLLLLFII